MRLQQGFATGGMGSDPSFCVATIRGTECPLWVIIVFWTVAAPIVGALVNDPAMHLARAQAQDWPTRPMTLVVPFSAGGSSDAIARIFADGISNNLRQSVVVENVTGVGGLLGGSRVARFTPDGYQFVIGNVGATVYGLRESEPRQAALRFLGCRWLQSPRVHAAQFRNRRRSYARSLSQRCTRDCRTSWLSRIDYNCPSLPLALPQIAANSVKPLAILSKSRSSILPELPSADEQGLTGFDVPSWYALFAPAATPAAIIQKLNRATVAALDVPAIQHRLQQVGGDVIAPERRTPEYLAQFLAAEIKKWEAPIKASGISL